jgi:hypothetical protein
LQDGRWLTFFVVGTVGLAGGSMLLNNIAAFIDKCIILRSHFLTTQKQKYELEAEKTDKEKKISYWSILTSYILKKLIKQ